MSRMVGWVLGLAVALSAAPGLSSQYWVEYEPANGNFPEQEGWIRHTAHGPPDERWIEDGWLVLDGMTIPGVTDYYEMPMSGGLDPDPGELFLLEWRIRVDELFGYHDPTVGIYSDEKWAVGFMLSLSSIDSTFEPGLGADFESGVPHTFEFRSWDMRTYVLSIDGVPAIEGNFWLSLTDSNVRWGDGVYPSGSLARWDYFRFGVVPGPLPGDVNCDGTVDFADINPFVQALTDAEAYHETYPGCWPENADINQDGTVDFGDINPFIALLTS